MRLYVTNKFFSLRGSSTVVNEQGNDVFKVSGKLFSVTKKKFVKTLDDQKIYMVRNKFWRFLLNSAYIYDKDGNKILKIKQRFSFKKKFKITGFTAEYAIEGDFWGWDFKVLRNNELIGSISRRFDVFKDKFCVEANNPKDASLLVAFVIAIDNIFDNNRDEAR